MNSEYIIPKLNDLAINERLAVFRDELTCVLTMAEDDPDFDVIAQLELLIREFDTWFVNDNIKIKGD